MEDIKEQVRKDVENDWKNNLQKEFKENVDQGFKEVLSILGSDLNEFNSNINQLFEDLDKKFDEEWNPKFNNMISELDNHINQFSEIKKNNNDIVNDDNFLIINENKNFNKNNFLNKISGNKNNNINNEFLENNKDNLNNNNNFFNNMNNIDINFDINNFINENDMNVQNNNKFNINNSNQQINMNNHNNNNNFNINSSNKQINMNNQNNNFNINNSNQNINMNNQNNNFNINNSNQNINIINQNNNFNINNSNQNNNFNINNSNKNHNFNINNSNQNHNFNINNSNQKINMNIQNNNNYNNLNSQNKQNNNEFNFNNYNNINNQNNRNNQNNINYQNNMNNKNNMNNQNNQINNFNNMNNQNNINFMNNNNNNNWKIQNDMNNFNHQNDNVNFVNNDAQSNINNNNNFEYIMLRKQNIDLSNYKNPPLITLIESTNTNPLVTLIFRLLSNLLTILPYYFNPKREEKILKKSKEDPNGTYLGPSFLKLLDYLWKSTKKEYFPIDLYEALKKLMGNNYYSNNPGFIMEFILNQLSKELNFNPFENNEYNNDNDDHLNQNDSFKLFFKHFQNCSTKITNSFFTTIKTQKKCSSCSKSTYYFNAVPVVNIILESSSENMFFNQLNLKDHLNNLLIEKKDEDINEYCIYCNNQRHKFVRKEIFLTFNIIIFYINREKDPECRLSFNYPEIFNGKELVNKLFDLYNYQLIAVIKKIPSENNNFGNYIAYCKSFTNNRWYSYNKQNISIVQNTEEILDNKNASLLIYNEMK